LTDISQMDHRMGQMTGHELLLALAGRISDQTLAQARQVLAGGAPSSAIALVASALSATPVQLTAAELTAIRELSGDAGALPELMPVDEAPALRFGFSHLDENGEIQRDELDEAVVAAAETHSDGLAGVWRAWRYQLIDLPASADEAAQETAGEETGEQAAGEAEAPAEPSASLAADYPDDPFAAYRVYIIQVENAELIGDLAADAYAAIPDPGQAGVEIITLGQELPPYQRAALDESLLLWATVAAPEFTVARVFDFADPVAGPGFTPDHLVVTDEAERERLLTYLRGGHAVLTTTATMEDILDPEAGPVVPTSFRTDGEWIWTDTVEYYLSRHGLAPDAELSRHIAAQVGLGRTVSDTDTDTAIRAADFLLNPPSEPSTAAVWFPGGAGPDDDADVDI
jgi:hypothetical protein